MSRRHAGSLVTCIALASLFAACGGRTTHEWATVREVTPGFFISGAAGDPALAADRHGRVALTWVSRDAMGQNLWLALSADSGLTFAAPVRVNPRPGSVSSHAENRPVAVFGLGGALLVAWSERRGNDSLITDVVVRASGDGGHTLGPTVVINDDAGDGKPIFHGFPTLAFLPDGGVFAAWVDHRERAKSSRGIEPAAFIFYALSRDGGQSWSDNRPLATHACARCRPTALADANGLVAVAYRGADGDRRHPALAVSRDRGATFPQNGVLVTDGWRLAACPVDGPALAMDGAGGGHYAWHTGSSEGGAWIAPWRADGGLAGMKRSLSDSLSHAGHPRLARLGQATLIALEGRVHPDSTNGVIAVRVLDADGTLTPWLFLGADAGDGWMATTDDRSALVCWVERDGNGGRVRVARVTRQGR